MRSRYNHDGSLDYHADSEHEILRRADEALERRRLAERAAVAAEHHSALNTGSSLGLSAPLSAATSESPISAAVPKMPHEELAERFAAQATPFSTSKWPTSNSLQPAGNAASRRRTR